MKLRLQATLGQAPSKIKIGGKSNPNLFQKEFTYTTTDNDNLSLLNNGYFFIDTKQYRISIGSDCFRHFKLGDNSEFNGNVYGNVKDDSKAVFDTLQEEGWACILTERERSFYNTPPEIDLPLKKPETLFR